MGLEIRRNSDLAQDFSMLPVPPNSPFPFRPKPADRRDDSIDDHPELDSPAMELASKLIDSHNLGVTLRQFDPLLWRPPGKSRRRASAHSRLATSTIARQFQRSRLDVFQVI